MFEKSWNHTFLVGDQVYDLLSDQVVPILKIILVTDDSCGGYHEERQSVKPSDDADLGGDKFFVVTVDVPPVIDKWGNEGRDRTVGEIFLPEEAEQCRKAIAEGKARDEATLGATTSEIGNRLGIDIADAAVVVADLAKCGLITDSGQRRRGTDNGEMEIVWL
jgi:hypothetical protein